MHSSTLQIIESVILFEDKAAKEKSKQAQCLVREIEDLGWSVFLKHDAYLLEGFAYKTDFEKDGGKPFRYVTRNICIDIEEKENPLELVLNGLLDTVKEEELKSK